ncbi:MAG: iron-containing alcohol dehydrogenase [Clostridia bacterium]|nr:iron-containing alcohol dehydrogenase [Clostridia bacterium]
MTELEKARKEINLIDSEIARLFAKRMDAVRGVAEYKKTHGLPVCDPLREEALLASVEGAFDDPVYAKYYRELLKKEIGLSKAFQHSLSGDLYVNTGNGGYEVVIARGGLDGLDKYLPNGIKTLVISDEGVPSEYVKKAAQYCDNAEIALFPQGEKNKTPETLKCLLQTLSKGGYDRASRVIAVGGGVVGDMAGLAASLYMRGIEFVNIPTTLLAQVDSCVGGKTGCDLDGVKNAFGTFYAPSKVIIDTETLQTLPRRHIANGLAEALKAALIGDPELFEAFENGDPFGISYETVIRRALKVKISVVEADEKESGLRRALNLGHTIGHGIESACGGGWLHGECVAVGMLPVCSPGLRARLIPIYAKLGLPESAACRADEVLRYCLNDKKAKDGGIITVRCDNPGEYRFVRVGEEKLRALIKQVVTE